MPRPEATRADLEREGAYLVLRSMRDEPTPSGGTVTVMQDFRVPLALLREWLKAEPTRRPSSRPPGAPAASG